MWNKKWLYFSLIIICLCSLNGCKSLRQLPSQKRQDDVLRSHIANNQRISKMDAKWSVQSGLIKVGGQMSLGPSSVWMNVQPFLGIETHRVFANEEVAQYLDRSQRLYVSENLQQMLIDTRMPLRVLRGLLSNQLASPLSATFSLEDFDYQLQENLHWELSCEAAYNTKWVYLIDEKGNFVELKVYLGQDAILHVRYDDFQLIQNDVAFPSRMTISSSYLNHQVNNISLYFNDISFDKEPKSAFSKPKNYTQVDAWTLLQSFNLF